jgi:pyridoxamine 5'-phosphate oxidase
MTREEMFAFMNENPVCYIATIEAGQPRVRGILLYRASAEGIIFHTGKWKNFYQQLQNNPRVEICFYNKGTQIRVAGEVELVEDKELREEIVRHPSRAFLKSWEGKLDMSNMAIYKMKSGKATTWRFETNFDPTVYENLF